MYLKQKKSNFMLQVSILAIAGILVRIIGLLYRGPLTKIIGIEGLGYYSTAYLVYAMILLMSSYSIPMAVSKVISVRLSLKEYKNAHRVFICSLIYVVVIGGAASIITYILAPLFVNNNSVLSLRILAPTIFFSGILGVFRGYYQAHNTMIQTSISQIIEQLFNALVSVLAAYLFTRPFLHGEDASLISIYGAAGGALGTGVGVLVGLAFMLFIYRKDRTNLQKNIREDITKNTESYFKILKLTVLMVTPVIFSTFIYNISGIIDMKILYKVLNRKGMLESTASGLYGIFSGEYMLYINVPVAIASAIASTIIPSVSGSYAMGNIDLTKQRIEEAIHLTMLIAIPSMVGLGVLSKPIITLLFDDPEGIAANLLRIGSVSVVFYSLSTVTNGVLQGIGQMKSPVKNAALALLIHLGVLIPLLLLVKPEDSVYVLVIATMVYSFVICILNGISVKKYLNYSQNYKKTFIIPFIASAIMGFIACMVYYFMKVVTNSNVLSLGLSIFFALIIYMILLIKMKGITEVELGKLPKGVFVLNILKRTRLIK